MTKFFLVGMGLLLGGWPQVGTAQTMSPVSAPEPAARQAVAGTRVWLSPPPGFGPAAGLTGLRRGPAALQVMEMPGSNYYRQAAGFNPARFTARGGTVISFSTLQVDGYPAQLARVQLSPTQETSQLLFGDSTFVVMLDARYPVADTAAGAALRRSLRSATYRPAAADAPVTLGNVVFVLDEPKSPFALALARRGTYTYTLGGQRKPDYGTEPQLTVSTYPYNPSITAADISDQLLTRPDGPRAYKPRKMSSGKVNDLVTYETEGFAQLQGQRVMVYQQVTVIGNTAVALQGIARQDFEQALEQFKSLTHTIKAR
ncbi:hypothetical protein [Hymenobacter psychrophilus]|uniref:Uncharacterized protein n=1 Tax=Hymenobacter psychrophilus TaxID=651662 RepID=A0A1H3B1M5_9BACT|nr:hypothetical protein [Hymenobacter psychrophilus]SDX35813.1 hypothetical protein SAMN04488069_101126 [Hymenobacter psychrophilus]